MTDFLLGLILFLLAAEALLRAWCAKEDARRGYVAPKDVKNKVCFVASTLELDGVIEKYNRDGYELVQLIYRKLNYCDKPDRYGWVLLFTKKKTKTHYE